ncbi:hypothetical protein SNOG_11586 [Parastagonospora nodorum SN15]|uniref:DUF7730 domain-containing protein n=1 Tax=Phaeosphaeria nodorum (strain SN15 / ATCC MYA-4574 / FGSC 10173) TaxID=321614 RepID=Q0U9H8_PHANO|nr:hypothetical protein SNOG_11586 [Parastagonospora nodorum SN15]EAT81294.1 hypothetical protein SNOG_11586 [Parastagonospora nodorum SN15]
METYIQIMKTASSPADPNAPSFLTSLPPEMRNAIYEVLFKREEPVLVHNAHQYHAHEPYRDDQTDMEVYMTEVTLFDQIFEAEIGADAEFHHDLHESLPLLHSCRQIYHECAGVLYGCNEFVVSRALNRHDLDFDELHPNGWLYSQLEYAPKWLEQLGSQCSLLRKVVIDVDALCPTGCEGAMDDVDMLPLARFLWYHANRDCTLEFAHTGRMLPMHDGETARDHEASANTFNNMLSALVTRDTLGIKKYSLSKHYLVDMEVSVRKRKGALTYRARDGYYSRVDEILISDEGRTLIFQERTQNQSVLLQLPQNILHTIIRYAQSSLGHLVLDVDNRTACGIPFNIFEVNRELQTNISFTRLQTYEITTNFNQFVAIKDLVPDDTRNSKFPKLFPEILSQSSTSAHIKITLRVNTTTRTTLDQVRIDIKGLLCLIRHERLGRKISIEIALSCPRDGGMHEEVVMLSLQDLQKRAFLLLFDVLAAFDLNDEATIDSPSIWINGKGTLLDASYPETRSTAKFSVANRHARLSQEEVDTRGYRMGAAVWNTCGYIPRSFKRTKDRYPLWALWRDLQRCHWSDHHARRPRVHSESSPLYGDSE